MDRDREEVPRQGSVLQFLNGFVNLILGDIKFGQGFCGLIVVYGFSGRVYTSELRHGALYGAIYISGSDVHLLGVVLIEVDDLVLDCVPSADLLAHQVLLPFSDLGELSRTIVRASLIKVVGAQTEPRPMPSYFIDKQQLIWFRRGRLCGD